MSCPGIERIAAAVTGQDAEAAVHIETCARCGAIAGDQLEVSSLAKLLPVPVFDRSRRAVVAAELAMRADRQVSRPRIKVSLACGLAIAAVATLWIGRRDPEARHVARVQPVASAHVDTPLVAPLRAAEIVATGGNFARETRDGHDVIRLHEGELLVDATGRAPISIVARDTTVAVADAKLDVIARHGVIVSAHVFEGVAEVIVGEHHIHVDTIWERPAATSKVAPPAVDEVVSVTDDPDHDESTPTNDSSFTAFRAGWRALHDGRNAEAIAQFDRAIDPGVAEDAMFWAAMAAERTGERVDARRRVTIFLERFPLSPRADAARAALVRLGSPHAR